MHETHAKTTTSRLLLCYSIYMDFHGSSSSGKKKKVLKVPITQAAKLFEGERENDLMKKMLLLPSDYLQVFTKGVQDYLGTLFEGL